MSGDVGEKYQTLVRRLYEKTCLDQLVWNETFNNAVYCTVGSNDVHLKNTRNSEGEPFEIVEVRDNSDNVIDSFTDSDLSGPASTAVGSFESYYDLMVALRTAARRKALGADKALDSILDILDDEVPF